MVWNLCLIDLFNKMGVGYGFVFGCRQRPVISISDTGISGDNLPEELIYLY